MYDEQVSAAGVTKLFKTKWEGKKRLFLKSVSTYIYFCIFFLFINVIKNVLEQHIASKSPYLLITDMIV